MLSHYYCREMLRDELASRKARSPGYSQAALARALAAQRTIESDRQNLLEANHALSVKDENERKLEAQLRHRSLDREVTGAANGQPRWIPRGHNLAQYRPRRGRDGA